MSAGTLQATIPLGAMRAELRRRLEMIRRQRPFPGRSIGTFGGPARAPAKPIKENTMTTETNDTQAQRTIDVECAKIILDAKCDALSAIANAIEALSSLDDVPKALFSHTIPSLAGHATYLAESLKEEVGIFFDEEMESAK